MKILASEKLSSHKYKTPEGYLICTDAILARTGKQDYMRRELFGDRCENPDEVVWVDRKADEVFSNETLSSFENKPITVEHPDEDVNPSNYKELAVGYVRDVKRDKLDDGTEVIKGNLVITDERTIEEILNGEHTDLSCGYDCEILDEDSPQQRRIRGNHVALCEEGRAGVARIVDSKINDKKYYIVKNGKYMLISGDFARWGHKNILSFFTSENAEKYGKKYLGTGDWEIEMRDSKSEDASYDYKKILREALRQYNKSFKDLSDDNLYNKVKSYIENKYGKDAFSEVYNYLANYINKHGNYEDSKMKDMAYIDISEDDWDEITNNGDDEHWIVNKYDVRIKRERGRVKVAATGPRQDLEKLYKDYHLRDYGVKIIDGRVEDSRNIEKIVKIVNILNKIK